MFIFNYGVRFAESIFIIMEIENSKIAIGVCGASAMAYAKKLLEILAEKNAELFVCFSNSAKPIFEDELDLPYAKFAKEFSQKFPKTKFYDEDDFSSPIASGSFYFDAMAICPLSMKTLGKIANGIADNLICRAADVALKERRRLVVVPRETPLALTHLRNMCTLSEAGAVVLPACPSFYFKQKNLDDIFENIAMRTISSMGFKLENQKQWGL